MPKSNNVRDVLTRQFVIRPTAAQTLPLVPPPFPRNRTSDSEPPLAQRGGGGGGAIFSIVQVFSQQLFQGKR